MATADQIKALLKSHAEGDEDRFFSVAMQMAAQAARQGHGKLAEEIRDIIDQLKIKRTTVARDVSPVPLAQPRGELTQVLSANYSKSRLSELIVSQELHSRLERILLEQRQSHKLREHGLTPRRKLLLVGPPGTGKTLTASALAGELHLPLFTIQFDGLITKFMGETAAKLRLVFDGIRTTRGVYFFDEFDAIGGKRSLSNDVGEIRRVLNSFLQFLEQSDSDSLIVAATNHVELLDRALFRRFDDVLEYANPTADQTIHLMKNRLGDFVSKRLDWKELAKVSDGLSFAEITRACEDAIKEAVLADQRDVSTQMLLKSISERNQERT